MRRTVAIAVWVLAVVSSAAMAAENWPDYRGPEANGHTDATPPLSWSETEHVKWKTAIPGKGWSSPVIWGDQVWLTTATDEGKERWAICVDKTSGKIVHHVKLFDVASPQAINGLNSHASPTAAIEAGRVYLHFGNDGTVCLDTASANVIWQRRDMHTDHQVGAGSSPILVGDLLIFHADGIDSQFVYALDKNSGATVWKTQRTADLQALSKNRRKSFSVPFMLEVNGRRELLSLGAYALFRYDPKTGEELWRLKYAGYSNVARPVIHGQLAIFSTGYDVPELWAVRLDGSGDVTDKNVAWKYRRNVPTKPSPLVVDGLFYMVSDSGIATCLDAASGEEIWKQRIGGQYTASLLYARGRIYVFDQETGRTLVLAPGREYKVLATSKLDEGFMASPAVSGNALFLRTKAHLYRIEE